MRFFVTGVGGQLGHDVMNEVLKRGHEGVGSDIQECYSGAADESKVTKAPYKKLDITDREAVHNVIAEVHPDAGGSLCGMDGGGSGRRQILLMVHYN